MGNRPESRGDDFHKMIVDMRKDKSRRVNINPQKKYLTLMRETLDGTKLPERLKTLISDTLDEKVSEVELIQTVTCINALRNNEFQSSIARSNSGVKDKPESKFVKVNFGEGFLKKILRKFPLGEQEDGELNSDNGSVKGGQKMERVRGKRSHQESSKGEDFESDRKEKLKIIGQVMRKQLNRMIHPFGKLNKAFAQYVEGRSEQFAPKNAKEQVYERTVQRLVSDWCGYLQSSCMMPYRKWIMSYTELQQGKYNSWLRHLLVQQIWAVNNGYLFGMLTTVIHRSKTPIGLDVKDLQESAALLTPSLFSIDPKLQIEGHFFDSIYQMAEICGKFRPEQILGQLQTVKKRICTDIDNYHRLVELGEVYEIDSDNILGIVAYILCKIASKIDQIHTHLVFLRILYGDKVYYSMGVGSYMLSTIFGAIEFLESGHFWQLVQQKKAKQRQPLKQEKQEKRENHEQGRGQSQTKGGTSGQEGSSARQEDSQGDRGQMQVNSLLDNI